MQLDAPDGHPDERYHHRQWHHGADDEAGPKAQCDHHDQEHHCDRLQEVDGRVLDRRLDQIGLKDRHIQVHAQRDG